MPQLEVAELVREHRLDLVGLQRCEQRIEEDDAPRGAEAGEEGIAVARPRRAVHHEQSRAAKPQRASRRSMRSRTPASAAAENLLNSGAISVG